MARCNHMLYDLRSKTLLVDDCTRADLTDQAPDVRECYCGAIRMKSAGPQTSLAAPAGCSVAMKAPGDRRSQRCLVLAHCLLAQCVRAEGLAKYFPGPVVPVLQFCISNEINIVQLPCPETLFLNSAGGLPR